jgi:cell division protease FtsH
MYKDKMLEEIAILFGGRISEEIFMHQMSTGASNDFERATKLARAMVTRYGMSEVLGTMVYEDSEQDAYFGRMASKTVSEATQQKVDQEIRRILDEQYDLARRLLTENSAKVELMATRLLEWETLDADQVNDIMEGRDPRLPKAGAPTRRQNDSSGDVTPPTATAPA